MSKLPTGWALTSLDSVTEFVRGVTYKKEQASKDPGAGRVPLLRATNISGGHIQSETDLVYVPDEVVKPEQHLRPGDVVVATSSGSLSVVGKSAALRTPWSGTFGAFCGVLRATGIDPGYLVAFVQSPLVRREWSAAAAGTNINNLKPSTMASTVIPIPPLAEQQRIVAAIEEQFSRLDAAETSLRQILERLDKLQSSAASAMTAGDWPEVAWSRCGSSQNGRAFPSRDYSKVGVKLLRPGNLGRSGQLTWTGANSRRLPTTYADLHPKYIVGPGEIVMNLTAQSLKDEFLGRVCLTGPGELCLLNQRLARLVPGDELDPEYLLWVFKSRPFRRFVDSLNTGSLIQHMFTSQLSEFPVPVPPKAEQRRIVADVQRVTSVFEAVGSNVRSALLRSAGLRSSVLQAAFSGALVPQDPSDQQADPLHEKAEADRTKREPAARTRRSTIKKAGST